MLEVLLNQEIKCIFIMTQKNENFEDLELNVWKPIAEEQILEGIRKFWGLAKVDNKSENFLETLLILHLIL